VTPSFEPSPPLDQRELAGLFEAFHNSSSVTFPLDFTTTQLETLAALSSMYPAAPPAFENPFMLAGHSNQPNALHFTVGPAEV
jgi:hypothetical protein